MSVWNRTPDRRLKVGPRSLLPECRELGGCRSVHHRTRRNPTADAVRGCQITTDTLVQVSVHVGGVDLPRMSLVAGSLGERAERPPRARDRIRVFVLRGPHPVAEFGRMRAFRRLAETSNSSRSGCSSCSERGLTAPVAIRQYRGEATARPPVPRSVARCIPQVFAPNRTTTACARCRKTGLYWCL